MLYGLSQELNDYLEENPSVDFEVVQVKSKFGVLRFHLDYRDPKTKQMISAAASEPVSLAKSAGRENWAGLGVIQFRARFNMCHT